MDPQVGTTAGQAPAQPDGQGQAPAVPAQQPAGTAQTQTDATERGDEFDPERARATISKLREFERQAKSQAKELEALRAQQKEREEADLSEVERHKRRAAELEAALTEERTQRRAGELRALVVEQATALGFTSPALAYRALDPGDVKSDDEGKHDPRSVRAALERLREAYPELADAQTRQQLAQQRQTEAQRNSRGLPQTPPASTAQPEDGVATARDRLVATGEYRRL